jgi:hypothetical protein
MDILAALARDMEAPLSAEILEFPATAKPEDA